MSKEISMQQKEYPMEDATIEKSTGTPPNGREGGVLAYKKEDVSHLETLNLSDSEAEELAALEKSANVRLVYFHSDLL